MGIIWYKWLIKGMFSGINMDKPQSVDIMEHNPILICRECSQVEPRSYKGLLLACHHASVIYRGETRLGIKHYLEVYNNL